MYLAVENGRLFRNAYICPHRRIVWVQLTRTCKRSNVGNTESERFCWGTYREVALPCLQPAACLPVCAWGAGVGRPLSALLALHQPLLGTHCGPRRVQRASLSAPAPPRALTWLPLTVGNGGGGWGGGGGEGLSVSQQCSHRSRVWLPSQRGCSPSLLPQVFTSLCVSIS